MKILLLLVFPFFFLSFGFCQEYLDANTMKIEEISQDKDYGYKPNAKKSIKVGSVVNEYKYINALTGPNGEEIHARRLGSCCQFATNKAFTGMGLLDQWEITYEGLEKPIVIYLNGYDYEKPKCPKGLNFKKSS